MTTQELEQIVKTKKHNIIGGQSVLSAALTYALLNLFASSDQLATAQVQQPDTLKAKPTENHSQHSSSIWGPSRPLSLDFRAGTYNNSSENGQSFVGIGEDHHGKLYLLQFTNTNSDAGDAATSLTGAARYFTLDDVLELKGVGTYNFQDKLNDMGVYATLRKTISGIKFKVRAGYEHSKPDLKGIDEVEMLAFRAKPSGFSFIEFNGLASQLSLHGDQQTDFGGGMTIYMPFNLYASANAIAPSKPREEGATKTLLFGRFAAYSGEKFPTGFLVYRGNNNKGFYLAGLAFGGAQQLVEPALIGMSVDGFFWGSGSLPALSDLRGMEDLAGAYSNDYEIGDFVVLGADFNTKILGTPLELGAREIDVYWSPKQIKELSDVKFHIDASYSEEKIPDFRTFSNPPPKIYRNIGFGLSPSDKFYINAMHGVGNNHFKIGVRKKF